MITRIPNNNRFGAPRLRIVGQYFIRPIPLGWACRASRLPGKAFNVAVAIWHQAGLRSSHSIRLSMKQMRRFGLHRCAVYHGLAALEHAELIKVERRNGLLARVTVINLEIDVPQVAGSQDGSMH
jgi:hypothetical protein